MPNARRSVQTTPVTFTPASDTLGRQLNEIQARAAAIAAEQARILRLLRGAVEQFARGTGDVTADADAAVRAVAASEPPVATAAPLPLAGRLEALLRERPRSFDEIVFDLGEPAGRVTRAMKALRGAGQVYNLGTEDRPRWIWVVGDNGSPEELAAVIEMMIRSQPMTFASLLAATGARRGRVSGVIVQMQRTGRPVRNLGDARHAQWFLEASKPMPRRRA